ncbi:MAG TPA: hypothetical protein VFL90_10775, partial [Methylomirabilota bacterium]|nr:hypothetical protein [Methylomirabilota bacterium]
MSRGAGVERDAHGRRTRERDRFGAEAATLAWRADGTLAAASVRLPDGGWLEIAPRAARDARWGASDVLRAGGAVLTRFAAVDWAAVDAIPVLAEPARLPAGAGTAVLNLIAALADDQRRGALAYRGPYPTEQLFLALLESFRWQAEGEVDPLATFMAGGLTWTPAPHTRALAPGGVYVQSRERIEKVVWRGRAYYRAQWQGVERHGPLRVRDADGRVICSLWALDTALEDHVVLSAGGDVLDTREPVAGAEAPRRLPPGLASGLLDVVVAGSAPPLAEALLAIAGELTFEWAPLAGALAAVGDGRARLSW